MSPETIGEIGIAGGLLLLVYKLVGVIVGFFRDDKKSETLMMTPLACQTDPKHFQRNMETHKMVTVMAKWTNDLDDQINKGALSCAWQGRDEVRDFKEAITSLGISCKALAVEMNLLRQEMVRTRNGGKT